MLSLAQPYMALEEKMNTRFDNPTSTTDVNLDCPSGNESQRQREDTNMMHTIGTISTCI